MQNLNFLKNFSLFCIILLVSTVKSASWFARKATSSKIAASPQIKKLTNELSRLKTSLHENKTILKKVSAEEKMIATNQIQSLKSQIQKLKESIALEKSIIAKEENNPFRTIINKEKARMALKKSAQQTTATTVGAAAIGGTTYGVYTLATDSKDASVEAQPKTTQSENKDITKPIEETTEPLSDQQKDIKKQSNIDSGKTSLSPKAPSKENEPHEKQNTSFLTTYESASNWQQDFSAEE